MARRDGRPVPQFRAQQANRARRPGGRMRREQGRARVDGMIARGEVERVPPSRDHADRLLRQAYQHLDSADAIAATDPAGAYQLLYDAARKALAGVLENEGL